MRTYYSQRKRLSIARLRILFHALYKDFENRYYFQEAFGYECVDAGYIAGKCGEDIEIFFLKTLRKEGLWPLRKNYRKYSEDDIFDLIELLFDLISKPVDGYYHSYADCGWHYNSFDNPQGQEEYRRD